MQNFRNLFFYKSATPNYESWISAWNSLVNFSVTLASLRASRVVSICLSYFLGGGSICSRYCLSFSLAKPFLFGRFGQIWLSKFSPYFDDVNFLRIICDRSELVAINAADYHSFFDNIFSRSRYAFCRLKHSRSVFAFNALGGIWFRRGRNNRYFSST